MSAQTNGIDITAGSLNCVITDNDIQNTNAIKDINSAEKGNGILLDSNGISQPQYITIKANKISSNSGIIDKSGIYSTSNINQHNKIDSNSIWSYKYGLHEYADMTREQ